MTSLSSDPSLELLIWRETNRQLDRKAELVRLLRASEAPTSGTFAALLRGTGDVFIGIGSWLKAQSPEPGATSAQLVA